MGFNSGFKGLNSILEGGECLTWRPDRLTAGVKKSVNYQTGCWVRPRPGLEALLKRNVFWFYNLKISRDLLGVTQEIHENSRHRQCSDGHSDHVPPEYHWQASLFDQS